MAVSATVYMQPYVTITSMFFTSNPVRSVISQHILVGQASKMHGDTPSIDAQCEF